MEPADQKLEIETEAIVFAEDVRVKRRVQGEAGGKPANRGLRRPTVQATGKSLRALAFEVRNALPNSGRLRPYLTLTYGETFPRDGKVIKYHIDLLGKWAKRRGIKGLWRMEFQKRGAPHFHVILEEAITSANLAILQDYWRRLINDIRVQINQTQLPVTYITKPDIHQPDPEMINLGRFWGRWNIKKAVAKSVHTGEEAKRIARVTRRHREKQLQKAASENPTSTSKGSRLSRVDTGTRSFTLRHEAEIARRVAEDFQLQNQERGTE